MPRLLCRVQDVGAQEEASGRCGCQPSPCRERRWGTSGRVEGPVRGEGPPLLPARSWAAPDKYAVLSQLQVPRSSLKEFDKEKAWRAVVVQMAQ